MEDEILKYKDWETGEEKEYTIKFGKGSLSHLICPFDKTPLIHTYDDWSNDVRCINCGEEFHVNGGLTQENLNEKYKWKMEKHQETLRELEEKKADLEARLKHAREVGLLLQSQDFSYLRNAKGLVKGSEEGIYSKNN